MLRSRDRRLDRKAGGQVSPRQQPRRCRRGEKFKEAAEAYEILSTAKAGPLRPFGHAAPTNSRISSTTSKTSRGVRRHLQRDVRRPSAAVAAVAAYGAGQMSASMSRDSRRGGQRRRQECRVPAQQGVPECKGSGSKPVSAYRLSPLRWGGRSCQSAGISAYRRLPFVQGAGSVVTDPCADMPRPRLMCKSGPSRRDDSSRCR